MTNTKEAIIVPGPWTAQDPDVYAEVVDDLLGTLTATADALNSIDDPEDIDHNEADASYRLAKEIEDTAHRLTTAALRALWRYDDYHNPSHPLDESQRSDPDMIKTLFESGEAVTLDRIEAALTDSPIALVKTCANVNIASTVASKNNRRFKEAGLHFYTRSNRRGAWYLPDGIYGVYVERSRDGIA